jgi:hypothetical protein
LRFVFVDVPHLADAWEMETPVMHKCSHRQACKYDVEATGDAVDLFWISVLKLVISLSEAGQTDLRKRSQELKAAHITLYRSNSRKKKDRKIVITR